MEVLGNIFAGLNHPKNPPLGGKLGLFLPAWERITGDPAVLSAVQGFQIPLTHTPQQGKEPNQISASKPEIQALQAEISDMLKLKVIKEVQEEQGQWVSSIFARPKNWGKRPTDVNLNRRVLGAPITPQINISWNPLKTHKHRHIIHHQKAGRTRNKNM